MDEPENALQRESNLEQLPDDVRLAVEAAWAKNAQDVVVLDLRQSVAFTDYFVICSGRSTRQVKAVAEAVEEALAHAGVKPRHVEGRGHAEWILLDCFNLVVHVFTRETRVFYGLERLWGSARPVRLPEPDAKTGSA